MTQTPTPTPAPTPAPSAPAAWGPSAAQLALKVGDEVLFDNQHGMRFTATVMEPPDLARQSIRLNLDKGFGCYPLRHVTPLGEKTPTVGEGICSKCGQQAEPRGEGSWKCAACNHGWRVLRVQDCRTEEEKRRDERMCLRERLTWTEDGHCEVEASFLRNLLDDYGKSALRVRELTAECERLKAERDEAEERARGWFAEGERLRAWQGEVLAVLGDPLEINGDAHEQIEALKAELAALQMRQLTAPMTPIACEKCGAPTFVGAGGVCVDDHACAHRQAELATLRVSQEPAAPPCGESSEGDAEWENWLAEIRRKLGREEGLEYSDALRLLAFHDYALFASGRNGCELERVAGMLREERKARGCPPAPVSPIQCGDCERLAELLSNLLDLAEQHRAAEFTHRHAQAEYEEKRTAYMRHQMDARRYLRERLIPAPVSAEGEANDGNE